ncbi:hypothetical protein [Alloactinosynnema sp. L-07]|nr:hypothetical protein [Alloactinosynnema sp. L-07]
MTAVGGLDLGYGVLDAAPRQRSGGPPKPDNTAAVEHVPEVLVAADRHNRSTDQAMTDSASDVGALDAAIGNQISFIEVYVLRLLAALGVAMPIDDVDVLVGIPSQPGAYTHHVGDLAGFDSPPQLGQVIFFEKVDDELVRDIRKATAPRPSSPPGGRDSQRRAQPAAQCSRLSHRFGRRPAETSNLCGTTPAGGFAAPRRRTSGTCAGPSPSRTAFPKGGRIRLRKVPTPYRFRRHPPR